MSNEKPLQRDRAIALEYKDAAELPKISASGVGALATRIVRIAEAHDIPIHENSELTELLSKLPSGARISPESYRLMAEVLCFLYYADKQFRANHHFLAETVKS